MIDVVIINKRMGEHRLDPMTTGVADSLPTHKPTPEEQRETDRMTDKIMAVCRKHNVKMPTIKTEE